MTHHRFAPSHYYSTLGTHAEVLVVKPGDTVSTTTVDARGVDAHGQALSSGPNPMTGPFYLEGAQVGDALQVHVWTLQPNRTSGWTRNLIASNVLDPDYVRELPDRDASNVLTHWHVDTDAGTAQVAGNAPPYAYPKLALDPMIGCFGVAPAGGEAISTATSGPHGGNMDYVGFRQGVTAWFPVSVEGGLFFLGDVHALQGDGEIVGTGIEISSDVEFTLDLVKGMNLHWPRGMDDEFLFTAGNARPLDQATQHATTEMSRWLTQDLGMDLVTAHIMMGQCVKYDLGNIYDPAYTMICKLSRADLAAWGISFPG